MKHITVLATLALTLLLASVTIVGCSSTATKGSSPSEDSTADEIASGPSLDELTDALSEGWSTETWYSSIVDIRVEQRMLAQVIVVETDMPSGQADSVATAQEMGDAIREIGYSDIAPNLSIDGIDGGQLMGMGSGVDATEALDLPATPQSAAELGGWIDAVFSDSGESWYGSIQTVEIATDVPGWGDTAMIVVRTDLPGGDAREQSIMEARMIGHAISMMGQSLAEDYQVLDANEENLVSGDIPSSAYRY
ncbi:MAG: hypothetical protein PF636_02860 [Actinomycetota bacterium]|jgi:hypothetical protein|nr:hypothetical protein [Actinomycetota bacterium]